MINRYFAVAAIIANALMVGAAGAETFTIRCERQASYGGDGAAVNDLEQALPATSEFTVNGNEFTTNSFGPALVNISRASVRQRGSRYELRFNFQYYGAWYNYTMEYNPNSGSYRQVINSAVYNEAVAGAEGYCRRI
jgi:hypothetical protein